jgi:drug/metabolite transporter (DMT)-like permease
MTLKYTSPLFLTGTRMVLAGFIIVTFLFFRKKKDLKITKKQIVPILLLAILSMYLTNALEFFGLQHLSAAKTCFIYSLTPFFAAFFSYLHFKEKMNLKKWIGMIIGFFGIVPVLYIQSGSENLTGGFSVFSLAELSIVGATVCSVYGWVLLRLLVKDGSLSPLTANGVAMLIGGVLAFINSILIDSWAPIPIDIANKAGFFKGVFLMTFISNILCYNLYGYLLKKYTATFLSFVGLLSPFFASVTGFIFLGEKPSLIILGSTFIVIAGLYLVYKEELKQGYIKVKVKNKAAVENKKDS